MMASHRKDGTGLASRWKLGRSSWRAVVGTGLLAAAAMMAAPQGAQAQSVVPPCTTLENRTSAYLAIVVNGVCTNVSQLIGPGRKSGTAGVVAPMLSIGGNSISVNAFWDADPFISFGLATTNLLAGSVNYSFIFSTPVVPGMYAYATGTLTGSVTAGQGAATVTNTAGSPNFVVGSGANGAVVTDLGVALGTGPCAAPTVTCGNGATSNAFAPQFFDRLQTTVTYTQSGLGSVVSFTGRIDLFDKAPSTTVPEPSTYALMAFGLFALGMVARRRQRAVS